MATDGMADISFEEAFTRLERAVQNLESGGLTLDEALALYESGMDLARRCAQLLDEAEVKIDRLGGLAEPAKPER